MLTQVREETLHTARTGLMNGLLRTQRPKQHRNSDSWPTYKQLQEIKRGAGRGRAAPLPAPIRPQLSAPEGKVTQTTRLPQPVIPSPWPHTSRPRTGPAPRPPWRTPHDPVRQECPPLRACARAGRASGNGACPLHGTGEPAAREGDREASGRAHAQECRQPARRARFRAGDPIPWARRRQMAAPLHHPRLSFPSLVLPRPCHTAPRP